MEVEYNQLMLQLEVGSSDEINETCRWAKAFGVPAILFKKIEPVKEKEVTQDISTLHDRKGISSTVLKARKILENLERIGTAIRKGEEIPQFIEVTAEDIAKLAKDSQITKSEIDSAKSAEEEPKSLPKNKNGEEKQTKIV